MKQCEQELPGMQDSLATGQSSGYKSGQSSLGSLELKACNISNTW